MMLNLETIIIIILFNSIQTIVNSQQLDNCPNVKSGDVLLSRKKRSLKFPDGSSFVVSLNFIQNLLNN